MGPRSSCQETLLNLQHLPVGEVGSVIVMVVEPGDPGAISLSDAWTLLRAWSCIHRLTVCNWPSNTPLRALGSIATTVPRLVVSNSAACNLLDCSNRGSSRNTKAAAAEATAAAAAAANQDMLVLNAHHARELRLGSQVQILSVSGAEMLLTLTTEVPSRLRRLTVENCPSLSLDLSLFGPLSNVSISSSRVTAINSLRNTVVSLQLENIPGLEELLLNDFQALHRLVLRDCQDLADLQVSGCDWLVSVVVSRCKALAHLQIGVDTSLPAAANSSPRLTYLSCDHCPLISSFHASNLPSLGEFILQSNGLQVVRIDGDSCNRITSIALAGNQELKGERCILSGNFPILGSLRMSHCRLSRMPVTSSVFPRLHTLDLRANCFRDPLDFTPFPALRFIDLDGNVAPPRDRGNKPFRLSLMVTPRSEDGGREMLDKLDGDNLRLVYENVISLDRLAPVKLADNEVDGDALGCMSSEEFSELPEN